jgi:hypothetical protein
MFGYFLDAHGDKAIIGAYGDDDNGDYSGSAYIFEYDGDSWTQQAHLKEGSGYNKFGLGVDIHNDYAIVGGDRKAYIYEKVDSTWTLQTTYYPEGETYIDLGRAVAITDTHAFTSSPYLDYNGVDSVGTIHILTRDGNSWSNPTEITVSDYHEYTRLGSHIETYGDDTLFVYALDGSFTTSLNGIGSVYVFKYDGTSWNQTQKIVPSDGVRADHFGNSIAVIDGYLAAGSPNHQDSLDQEGAIYLFENINDQWVEVEQIVSNQEDGRLGTWITSGEDFFFATGYTKCYDISPPASISISDINDPSLLTLTYNVSNGILSFDDTTGLTFIDGGDDSIIDDNNNSFVALQGSIDNINAALKTLRYIPNDSFYGDDTLTITAINPSEGLTTTFSRDINVLYVNKSPSLTNNTPPLP